MNTYTHTRTHLEVGAGEEDVGAAVGLVRELGHERLDLLGEAEAPRVVPEVHHARLVRVGVQHALLQPHHRQYKHTHTHTHAHYM
jgi:hypothetical protein